MGIGDRSWYRDEPRGASPWTRSRRTLSVNTWLIILCVAVFVIDGFLPLRHVPTNRFRLFQEFRDLDAARVVVGKRELPVQETVVDRRSGRPVVGQRVYREAIDRQTGQSVGIWETRPMHMIESWLYFSTDRILGGVEYWRLIGFQFLHDHSSLAHLAFNMLGLFFFGGIVEQRLGGKRYLAFYLLCGIFGALTYLVLNLMGWIAVNQMGVDAARLPFILVGDPGTPLIGASAGVYGVLMAGAYLVPHATVYLFFVIPVRFDRLPYILVGISLLTLAFSGTNAGGEAAHLGGAVAGAYFIRRQHHLHGFFDILGRVDPTSRSSRARREQRGGAPPPPRGTVAEVSPAEVDRILDKIRAQGMASLTDAERRALRGASGRAREAG